MNDGLSQKERYHRIESVRFFTVIDNSIPSLLRQAETIAGFIRYYGLDGRHKGYFDQFLNEIKQISEDGGTILPDEKMEPAQALLFTFLRQLRQITGQFNERWNNYASWYINEVLKVSSQLPCSDNTWISLEKNLPEDVYLKRGTPFTFDEATNEDRLHYRLAEPITVTNVEVKKAFFLNFEKDHDVYPAGMFHIPTELKMKDLLNKQPSNTQSIGLRITSPSLLLREGKRFVTLSFKTERSLNESTNQLRDLVRIIQKEKEKSAPISHADAKEVTLLKVFSDIFYLEISTPEGWKSIDKYVIKRDKIKGNMDSSRMLTIKFELPENFPVTIPCRKEVHGMDSLFPTLRILLNRDAWLFPYTWLKNFMIMKIHIDAQVEGINNILFYNELGKIDNAAPFAPFGINTERGAWFAIGNYEMALKQVRTTDIHIHWQQLPRDEGGLFSYYQNYRDKIDNRSFRLIPKYLSDYKWKDTGNTGPVFLFSTLVKDKQGNPEPQYKLSEESVLRNILLEDMKPLHIPEEEYDYSIRSKSGFFSFILEEPAIGFGEKRYRQLFSENMIKKALRKKNASLLNSPITPLIERITLSYTSSDEIDFRSFTPLEDTTVAHIYPLGENLIYPSRENKPMPFVFSLDTDTNILFALKNVKGEEFVNLYLHFLPQKKEVSLSELPRVKWYWGDGYHWYNLPDESIRKNDTLNLLSSGGISLYLPEIKNDELRDNEGLVWLRAGITQNEKGVSVLHKIYTNAAKVVRDLNQMNKELLPGFTINLPEENLPGIVSVKQIAPFFHGKQVEDEKHKLLRVSEFISHRGRAVTIRDFERITLQAFPEISKVKCLPNTDTKALEMQEIPQQGVVTLVIIPDTRKEKKEYCSYASPDLLLQVEKYFEGRVSSCIKQVDAINPVYEEVLIRCEIEFYITNQSNAISRTLVRKVINHTIAPWMKKDEIPSFDHSFQIQQLYDKIKELKFVREIRHLSAIQMCECEKNARYSMKEYTHPGNIVKSSRPYAILVPAHKHIIASELIERFGIQEMGINENFVIWQNEIEKH